MNRFALQYSPGPNWENDKSIYDQDLKEHIAYMERLHKEGKLLMGGPFSDSTGGLALLKVGSIEEAADIVEKDPAVLNGVFEVAVRPWHVALGS